MKHLKAVNSKADRVDRATQDVVALQRPPQQPESGPHIPIGCSLVFSPGWEADRNGGNFNAMRSATLGEWQLATSHAVSGSKTLSISLSSN